MKLVRVILDIKSNALSSPFTYAICNDGNYQNGKFNLLRKEYLDKFSKDSFRKCSYDVEIGCIVIVPFGKQFRSAYVVEILDDSGFSEEINFSKLKPIVFAVTKPLFNKENIKFAKFISKKYMASFASCINLFIPSGISVKTIKNDQKWHVNVKKIAEVEDRFIVKGNNFDSYKPRDNAVKQKLILNVLKNGNIKEQELRNEFGSVTQAVKSLKNAGAIDVLSKRKIRSNFEKFSYSNDSKSDFCLTEGQKIALECINYSIDNSRNDIYVLDGVTGSGKTEVYLQAISNVINQGKNACVLVPEISLTPQTVARFRARLGDQIAVLHSKMSTGERYDQWCRINSGDAKLVIGARSALFSPLQNIGLIVIDEEHESTYKQDNVPRYHARDCAIWLSKQSSCTVILGSATPSLESLNNCKLLDNWKRLVLPERTNKKPLPKIELVDMGQEFKGGSKSLFSHKLAASITQELSCGNKVVLFHNRRGFANYMFCRSCGFTPECPNCSTALTYHQKIKVDGFVNGYPTKVTKEMLVCHHCGHMEQVYVKCPKCNSPYIAKYGAGTQSVEDQLQTLITDLPNSNEINIVRMDADTTRKKFGHQECLEAFAKPGPAVLLGTQMIAKGLDFDDVTLVGAILIDTSLSFPDFRASEKTFNLILQVAGRAGRANLPGKVIIQSYTPETDCIKYAASYNREAFHTTELMKRKLLKFPPYNKLVNIIVSSWDEALVIEESEKIYNKLFDMISCMKNLHIELSKPTACVLSKVRKKYRYHIILKYTTDYDIEFLRDFILKYKKPGNLNILVDVDPASML